MPSVAQVVPTIPVFDYLYDPTSGKALANQEVIIQLEFNKATAIAPVVSLPNLPLKVTTDPNGYWTANLVPNTNINPANTVYSVRAGGQSFQISIPAGPGPYQASAIATTTPPAMVPAGPFTAGSVLFAGAGGAATQDNANFFWNSTNKWLGIGTSAPGAPIHGVTVIPNDTTQHVIFWAGGTDVTLGPLNFLVDLHPSASAASRYVAIASGDGVNYRALVLNPAGGVVGIGTTSPSSKLDLGAANLGDGAQATSRLALYDDQTNIAYFTYDATTALRLKMSGGPFIVTAVPTGAGRFGVGTDVFRISLAGGPGFYGHAAPAQPAAPVTLADVIAIIRGCGLSA